MCIVAHQVGLVRAGQRVCCRRSTVCVVADQVVCEGRSTVCVVADQAVCCGRSAAVWLQIKGGVLGQIS